MAASTISTFTVYRPFNVSSKLPLQMQLLQCQSLTPFRIISNYSKNLSATTPISPRTNSRTRKTRAIVEEEAVQYVGETISEDAPASSVSVQVSPSDVLTMLFRAEGTMNEAVIPAIYQGLEGIEGVAGLRVQVVEGIASVELTKETTVQATGVASSLVGTIQGSGFKLQKLNLSFQDEEDMS